MDIAESFMDELRNKYGTSGVDYQSKIETIDNSYAFLKFGILFIWFDDYDDRGGDQ
jgi:hypothetical protein